MPSLKPTNNLSNTQNFRESIIKAAESLGQPAQELPKITIHSSARELNEMLASARPQIEEDNGNVSKNEAAWFLQAATHPNSSQSLRQEISTLLTNLHLSPDAEKVHFDELIKFYASDSFTEELKTENLDLSGIPNIFTQPSTSPASVHTWNPKIDIAPTDQTNPLKFIGDVTFEGPYTLNADALLNEFGNITDPNQFGTTNVELPNGSVINVKDMMYPLGDDKVGMRLIPVNDSGMVTDVNGDVKSGSQLMDEALREEMGLEEGDPIYTLVAYIHPELHTGGLGDLGASMLKTEMGNTHLGAYIGEGVTSNSPEDYHGNAWGVSGYPANVQVVSLDGVDQKTLNKNALLVDAALNEGVKFPGDYKNDKFRTIDLNTSLFFYKEWLMPDPENNNILREDSSWATYCAEHKTIVANVMLNVPHNPKAFSEIFGDDGEELWEAFKTSYADRNGGTAFTSADETDFEPLWKKEGLTIDEIRPWENLAEYEAYDTARHSQTLGNFDGFKPLIPGQGMAWPPETTADLVKDFADTYTSLRNVGGAISAATIVGFMGQITDRMGLTDESFLELALPIMSKLLIADAMMNASSNPQWFELNYQTLYGVLAAGQVDTARKEVEEASLMNSRALFEIQSLDPFSPEFEAMNEAITESSLLITTLHSKLEGLENGTDPSLKGLVDAAMSGAKSMLPQILGAPAKNINQAEEWFEKAIDKDMKRARRRAVTSPAKTQFYSPPAVSHRVAIGMHESSPFVNVRNVATAVDFQEVETN